MGDVLIRLNPATLAMLREMGCDLSRVDLTALVEAAVMAAYAIQVPRPQVKEAGK